ISGSGSTMLAIVGDAAGAEQLQKAAAQRWPEWQVRIVTPSEQGVQVVKTGELSKKVEH
ncbi:MAG TPA: homoserine kinase, partial [Lactobacillus sp.]|nr:homoserine kinase [Lactobacillus sp.]